MSKPVRTAGRADADVGRVELGALNYTTYGYLDTIAATVLVVSQQPGSNALATANAIKSTMKRVSRASFPKGSNTASSTTPPSSSRSRSRNSTSTILEAVALVVLVVLVFLQTWRATLIPLVAIPVSLVGTFAVMAALGFSVNMLTLFGLVLAVGIVVDDAIVVVENVERKLAEGLSPLEAARLTMDEVGAALIAIALVLSAVFIPTAFIGGITGQFYRQFAVTVATATIISAFNSLTLSPALCALLLKRTHTGRSQGAADAAGPRCSSGRSTAFSTGCARLRRAGPQPSPASRLMLARLRRSDRLRRLALRTRRRRASSRSMDRGIYRLACSCRPAPSSSGPTRW